MNDGRYHLSRSMRILYLGAVAWSCTPAMAAGDTTAGAATTRYQRERAACKSGQSNQDRASCLREASAAQAQAHKGGLDDGAASYGQNARKRCEALPSDDRQACLERMQGQGSTSGSVAGGGIYRELVTTQPDAPVGSKATADAPVAPPR